TSNSLCRRCHLSLDEDEAEIAAMTPAPEAVPINIHTSGRGHLKLAYSIRSLRLRNGLSQATGAAHVRAADLRVENRKRESHAHSLFAGAAGQGARGQRA